MANTTLFDVVDYLVSTFTGLSALADPVVVFDGFPGVALPPVFVSVGGSVDPTVEDAETWASLGARSKDEEYRVNCYVSSFVGGSSNADQKAARDAAKTAFYAVEAALRADVTLGGKVFYAGVDTVRLDQTNDADAADGRRAEIHFAVRCMARI